MPTTSSTPTVRLAAAPGLLGLYARALLPKPAAGGAIPARRLALADVPVDPAHLRRYAEACGFPPSGTLPATYPHVVAFPLAMALMTRRDFPHPLLGLVHLANRIDRLRPVGADERLSYQVWAEPPRSHPKGTAFDIVAEATAGAEPVWRSASTYLRRGPGDGAPDSRPRSAAPTGERLARDWELPAGAGRRYAAVSGDRNPIHLHPLTARAFGFRRAIAHGMWTKARCLAELDGHLPDAYTVRVDFRSPLLLPGRARFRAERAHGGWEFEVRGADAAREHLRGSVSAAR